MIYMYSWNAALVSTKRLFHDGKTHMTSTSHTYAKLSYSGKHSDICYLANPLLHPFYFMKYNFLNCEQGLRSVRMRNICQLL